MVVAAAKTVVVCPEGNASKEVETEGCLRKLPVHRRAGQGGRVQRGRGW